MSKSKRKPALAEPLESRTLLSAAPQVMGYLVDYKIADVNNTVFSEKSDGTIAHDNLNWKGLTQVNYFALLPNASPAYNKANPASTPEMNATSDGGLQLATDSGYDPAVQLPMLISEAKKGNPGIKVFVTVGGGDANGIYDMDALVNTPSAWGTFATNVRSFCNKYGLAGVDLDWEPTAQAGFTVTAAQIENFGNLVGTIKADDPGLTVTADALGDPVALSTSAGADTGKSAFMLNSTAVANLDAINVEAYPVASEAEANTVMQGWAAYVAGGKDLDGTTVNGRVGQLQYGLDVASDDTTNQPAGVVERKTDATIANGYGGLFIFELDSDTANPSALSRISSEIAKNTGGGTGSISGSVKTSSGAGLANVMVWLDADNNTVWNTGELKTLTNSSGAYSFANVPAGAYIVRQSVPAGDTQSSPANNFGIHVTLTSGGALANENFIDTVPATTSGGSVGGSVKTSGGAGISGVTVYLDSNNNGALDVGEHMTLTGASGTYGFANVPAGTYVVRQSLPAGTTQTSPSGGLGIHITVSNGGSLTGKNFTDAVAASGPSRLSGALIGSTNALNHAAAGHGASNAFDNNVATTFEDTLGNGNWVGLDLGSARTIKQIKFAADPANPSFMEGGVFQASSTADFSSDVVDLYQVPNTSTPSTSLTPVGVGTARAFRYVRYLAPAGSFGDVAEVQFFG